MEVSEDRIVLKGKKYGNKMVMTKLTESAGSYMQKVLDMQEKMAAVPRMKMVVGGKVKSPGAVRYFCARKMVLTY